jgi:hypothetical protein
MNELTYTQLKEILPSAKSFLEHAHEDLRDIGNRYFMLGCRLWEAQRYHYVEALGYVSIEQLAEKEFDLGRSSTYNLINIFERFCARGELGQRKAWIDPKYKNYKYSQLIEMEKAYCLRTGNIEKQIPPGTPVRVLKEYIKYINKQPGDNKDLPDWEVEQKQTPMLPPVSGGKQIAGQLSIENTEPDKPQNDTTVNTGEELPVTQNAKQTAPVQTFGLPTHAKVKSTEPKFETLYIHNLSREELTNIIDKTCKIFEQRIHTYTSDGLWLKTPASCFADELYPKIAEHILQRGKFLDQMNNPPDVFDSNKYSLQSRQGVRDFLADYKSWHQKFGFNNFYFNKVYSCTLKDQTYIYACERKIYVGALQLGKAETKVTYFFNAYKGDGVSEISQTQFEQYCAEHKDEL